jgi:hypothetical protein
MIERGDMTARKPPTGDIGANTTMNVSAPLKPLEISDWTGLAKFCK